MSVSPEEARQLVAARLAEGKGRWEILHRLRALGMGPAEAERFYERERAAWLRENLPAHLRASGRRHLGIGLAALAVSLGLAAFVGWIYYQQILEHGVPPFSKLWVMGGIVVLTIFISVGEIGWACTRFGLARRAERERPKPDRST
jgi:hypothetical protein